MKRFLSSDEIYVNRTHQNALECIGHFDERASVSRFVAVDCIPLDPLNFKETEEAVMEKYLTLYGFTLNETGLFSTIDTKCFIFFSWDIAVLIKYSRTFLFCSVLALPLLLVFSRDGKCLQGKMG